MLSQRNTTKKKICYAKWSSYNSVEKFPACVWSGPCFNTNGGHGYIYVDFGRWSGRMDQHWVSVLKVRAVKYMSHRVIKPVNQFSSTAFSPKGKELSWLKDDDGKVVMWNNLDLSVSSFKKKVIVTAMVLLKVI